MTSQVTNKIIVNVQRWFTTTCLFSHFMNFVSLLALDHNFESGVKENGKIFISCLNKLQLANSRNLSTFLALKMANWRPGPAIHDLLQSLV